MSQVNQLIAKAMSTSSEDEAFACLRMARKKNAGASYNHATPGTNDKYYDKAKECYELAKKYQGHSKHYEKLANDYYRLYNAQVMTITKMQAEIIMLRKKPSLMQRIIPYMVIAFPLLTILTALIFAAHN